MPPEILPPSPHRPPEEPSEPDQKPVSYLTLHEAAQLAGCSDSTLRRLVKSGDVPHLQEETKTGFRYLFEPSVVPLIAHKASMRRPSGRPGGRRVTGERLQSFSDGAYQEASRLAQELAAVRAERDLLRAENARLWSQIERLTESVTRLALPASKPPEEAQTAEGSEKGGPRKYGFWDYFFGRGRKT